MNHVVLLGDSIFDNAAYVPRGASVVLHLRAVLGTSWKASSLAVDGNVTRRVAAQLEGLPSDTTHLVVSAGGNDALQQASVLSEDAQSVAGVLHRMSDVARGFERDYLRMIAAIIPHRKPTALCTIYYPSFDEEERQRASVAALTVFNDCIVRAAAAHGFPLLDLRLICNDRQDYAHEIEPSDSGGMKIACAIKRLLTEHDFRAQRATIYV
jgi:hypothetical protein